MEKKCTVDGCEKISRSKGLCQTHYMRVVRQGTTADPSEKGYGLKTSHPLYITWMGAKRGGYLGEGWSDFWQFVKDVGEKPGSHWSIYRLDVSKPYEKGNVRWREGKFVLEKYESRKALREARNQAKGEKSRREHDPAKHRARMLKANYGITVEQYDSMLKQQGGVCGICKKPETRTQKGKPSEARPLSVDHCHDKLKVRELLCSHCNTALGLMNDDVRLLQACIDYLKRHRE